jgi:hypothetical protein
MRYACTVLLVLGIAASASAQRRGGGEGHHQQQQPQAPAPQPLPWWSSWNSLAGKNPPPPVGTPLPPIGTPQNALAPSQPTYSTLPTIGLGLPSIGLGLPAIGLPPQNFGTQPMNPRAPYRGNKYRRGGDGLYYTVPPYGYPAAAYGVVTTPGTIYPSAVETYPPPQEPPPAIGGLRLEVEPSDLVQVFVDGVFIGSPRDIGNEITLEPGTRRIELRAQGYKTVVFNAQIFENRTIVYRATMEKDPMVMPPPPVELPPVAPTGSRTLYVIPGCYLGNVAPQEVKLPPGCDLGKLRTVQ